jgi:hypothetical protein
MSPSQPRPATGDTKIIFKDDKAAPSPLPAKQTTRQRRRWLLAAAAVLGLLLIAGLGIGLPLGLRKKQQNAVGLSSSGPGVQQLKGTTRTYYLAADSVDWDYAPSGRDVCRNKEFTGAAELYMLQGISAKYKKAVYKRYMDTSFQVIPGFQLPGGCSCCKLCSMPCWHAVHANSAVRVCVCCNMQPAVTCSSSGY